MKRVTVIGGRHERSASADLWEAFNDIAVGVEYVHETRLRAGRERDLAWVDQSDLVVWAPTHLGDNDGRRAMMSRVRDAGIPIIGYHPDLFWGLSREHVVTADPFFRCDLVVTTDGGHDDAWAAAGVNHLWVPPVCRRADTELVGGHDPIADGNVVFVGAWEQYPHPEWGWRVRMIQALRARFGPRFVCYPRTTRTTSRNPVVGQPLADIYQSAAVVVGDSCFAGIVPRYWSDRVPRTLGMGGVLVHPHVDGIDDWFVDGEHLLTFPPCDIDALSGIVADVLAGKERRVAGMREAGRELVREQHTFHSLAERILSAADETAVAIASAARRDASPSV